MAKTNNYDESNIQILEGLEAVRKRPGMYIGSTDGRGLHHLVWEIVDNAVDEALSGYGDLIEVTINKDNSIRVEDHGRGMPTGMHASGKPTTEVILTILHAGGKFNEDGGYKTSGGLHGVGASVVNALSKWLEVTVYRDGKICSQRFEDGAKKIGKLKTIGKTNKTGTVIEFMPDDSIFSTTNFDYNIINERLRETSYLLSGVQIDIEDKRTNKKASYKFDNGLESFIQYLNLNKTPINNKPIFFTGESKGIEAEIAMQFTTTYQDTTISFVNLVRTGDGGTHETGFRSGLTKAINEYARKYGLLKPKDKNLEGTDVREGMTAIISAKVPEHLLQFEGQTKGKLGTPDARPVLDAIVYENMTYYLEENKETADALVTKMIKASQVREATRKARETARKGKTARQERILSGKLAPAQSKDSSKKELYLVEGDSAGGSAKQGRDRKYQAILPLRGKVLNSEKSNIEDILKNEELSTLVNTIGAGVDTDFHVKDSHYDKIIIMTDADTDGAHIQILLLTFFYRHMRDLIKAGKVYIAMPPLYKVSKKSGKSEDHIYAWEDDELEAAKKKIGRGYGVQRYKGLGEMNSDQLWETTMNPETRTLIQVTIDDPTMAERRVSVLMGDKVEPRREWIEDNVQFTLEDNFKID
ncbi:MAG: DNA topoisomerase IV subunit B [Thomasclavelia sp.]|nr:DNA topoisomerase IV subunit B [Thomasclavelia sp.]